MSQGQTHMVTLQWSGAHTKQTGWRGRCTSLSLSLCLSLSLSLSIRHTHTHTHTHRLNLSLSEPHSPPHPSSSALSCILCLLFLSDAVFRAHACSLPRTLPTIPVACVLGSWTLLRNNPLCSALLCAYGVWVCS